MSIQVGQEVTGLLAQNGDKGVVIEIGSRYYENCIKVRFSYWGECWISNNNGEDATWIEQEEEVVAEAPAVAVVEEVQEVAKVAKELSADERRALVNLERDRNIPASGPGISPKEAAYRLDLTVEQVKAMLAEGKFQSAYREVSRAHEGLQDWISWKEVDALQDHSKAVQPPDSFYH